MYKQVLRNTFTFTITIHVLHFISFGCFIVYLLLLAMLYRKGIVHIRKACINLRSVTVRYLLGRAQGNNVCLHARPYCNYTAALCNVQALREVMYMGVVQHT